MKAYEPVMRAGRIEGRILLIRGQRVMLSTHLADLYGVEPKVLVQAVKRNASRFPEDFMFQLSREEFNNLKSQIVTSSWGGLRRATREEAAVDRFPCGRSEAGLSATEAARGLGVKPLKSQRSFPFRHQ